MTSRLATALADRYRIERELGAGGMATVYLADDLKHGRQVAIKVLKPELAAVLGAERFVQEIKTTAALSHPHILPLFDSGEADGFLYYVMPYIQGETIRERLNRETQLSVDEAVRITREIADALDYAHRNGVIHRDIKPENLLLHDGRAMVMDFGIALAVSAAAGGRMTETGLSLGTPHYMSPEQATADKSITGRSDIYSLASVCYEMLTGNPPHVGSSAQQIIMKIIAEPVQPVEALRKSVPQNVAAALAKALEKLPADRFETAKGFAEALVNKGFTVAATSVHASTMGGGKRSRAPLVAAGLVGALVAGAALWTIRSPLPPPEVLRFTFELADGWTVDGAIGSDAPFALSPDARQVAYIATDSLRSGPRLFVRDLDQLEPRLLAGAVRPSSPFYSPDGKWIAYFTEDDYTLFKIPVDGGPPIRLATNARNDDASGAWSDDGRIYYAATNRSIASVPATGGASTPLSTESEMQWMGLPFALPGGKTLLVTACPAGGACVLQSVDIASGKSHTLVEAAARGWYLGDGLFMYVLDDGSVLAAKFDAERGELSGAAAPLFSDVWVERDGIPRLSVSATGTMMYQPRIESQSEVELLELDRRGRPTERLRLRDAMQSPRLSPSTTRVAVARTAQREAEIWIYDIPSKTFAPLADGKGSRPAWSPDERRIAFQRTAGSDVGIFTVRVDGSAAATKVASQGQTNGTPSYSRDGNWIVFDGAFEGGMGEDIYAVGTGEDRTPFPVVQSAATEEAGVVSPDGRWIAYTADETRTTQVYIRPFRREGGRWLVSAGAAAGPAWTTNNELVYQDLGAQTMVAAKLAFTPDPQILARETLFDTRGYLPSTRSIAHYDVSRDGQRFLVLRGADIFQIRSPVVVLNWREEVRRVMREQGGAR